MRIAELSPLNSALRFCLAIKLIVSGIVYSSLEQAPEAALVVALAIGLVV